MCVCVGGGGGGVEGRVGERVTYWVLKLSQPCRSYSRRGRFCCTSLLAVSQKIGLMRFMYDRFTFIFSFYLFLFCWYVCVCVWGVFFLFED